MTQHQSNRQRRHKGVLARTTDAAERIHRAVAGFPLDVLEQVDRLAAPVARIRKLQDRSITARYEMVRGVNRELALLAGGRPSKASRKAARRAAAKPHAAAKVQHHRPPTPHTATVRPEAIAT